MKKHLHIVGICGTFMGGIALLARQLGFKVTGSDENIYPPMSDTLAAHGIEILPGYDPSHLDVRPDEVLLGNVCKRGSPIVEAILKQGIPFNSGPAWLAEHVLRQRHVLAVAGTHGKTTTTSLLAWILTQVGLNPGYLIGGVAHNFSTTAYLGSSDYFVIEADEYDTAFFDKRPKFLHYFPRTLILNNLEFDHADIYPDLAAIEQQFHFLIRTVPPQGRILYPQQDMSLKKVLQRGVWSDTYLFCGTAADWQVTLHKEDGSIFEVYYKNQSCGRVHWPLWGRHNIENALASLAAAHHIGIEPSRAVAALNEFQGVKRRLEIAAEIKGITLYDDFAHHPTAIEKTLQALRMRVAKKPIIAVLQFGSNTMRLGGHAEADIAKALEPADQVLLFNSEWKNVNLQELCQKISAPSQVFQGINELLHYLKTHLKTEDQVLMMSNKGFDGLRQKLIAIL